jgi:hypothetical protein
VIEDVPEIKMLRVPKRISRSIPDAELDARRSLLGSAVGISTGRPATRCWV